MSERVMLGCSIGFSFHCSLRLFKGHGAPLCRVAQAKLDRGRHFDVCASRQEPAHTNEPELAAQKTALESLIFRDSPFRGLQWPEEAIDNDLGPSARTESELNPGSENMIMDVITAPVIDNLRGTSDGTSSETAPIHGSIGSMPVANPHTRDIVTGERTHTSGAPYDMDAGDRVKVYPSKGFDRQTDVWLEQGENSRTADFGNRAKQAYKQVSTVEEFIQSDIRPKGDYMGEKKEELVVKEKVDPFQRAARTTKRSKIIAKQLISQSSANALGFVSQMWVNSDFHKVVALEVRPSLLSGQVDGVHISSVVRVGDFILVTDEDALESEMTVPDYETLVGYDIVTEDGYSLGKVRDYTFNLEDGKITSLEFDSLGNPIVPSNLISTYWLDIEAVMKVSSDSILVKEAAESQVRRLTKGLFQLPSLEERAQIKKMRKRQRVRRNPSKNQKKMYREEISQFDQLSSSQSSNSSEEAEWNGPETPENRWLPMDYGTSQRKDKSM